MAACFQSVTILEGDTLTVTSRTNDENKVVRRYEFTDDEVILVRMREALVTALTQSLLL